MYLRRLSPARFSSSDPQENIGRPFCLRRRSHHSLACRPLPSGKGFLEYFSVFWLVSPGIQRGPPLRSPRTARPE